MLDFLKKIFRKPGRGGPPVLMVVAKNEITQESLQRDFKQFGCQIISSNSAESAWKYLEFGAIPDIILLDFVLPADDGPTFYRQIFMDKRFVSVPIVPLIDNHPDEHRITVDSMGGNSAHKSARDQARFSSFLVNTPTEFNTTPEFLFISVAQTLRKANIGLPLPFRQKIQALNRTAISGLRPSDS